MFLEHVLKLSQWEERERKEMEKKERMELERVLALSEQDAHVHSKDCLDRFAEVSFLYGENLN